MHIKSILTIHTDTPAQANMLGQEEELYTNKHILDTMNKNTQSKPQNMLQIEKETKNCVLHV